MKKRPGIITFKVKLFTATGFILMTLFYTAVLKQETVRTESGAYIRTEHGGVDQNGNTTTGVSRPANTPAGITISTTDFPAGTCIHCHSEHGSYGGSTHTTVDLLLFDPGGANTNRFCYTCHTNANPVGGTYSATNRSFMGQAVYDVSSHGLIAAMVWPGTNPPARAAGDANKCLNCHNPHGRTFTSSGETASSAQKTFAASDALIHNLVRNEENLCLTCHDGSPANAAKNINAILTDANVNNGTTFYDHPISRYTAAGDRTPSAHTATETKALTAATRHSECQDCHNPHQAKTGTHAAPTSTLSNVLDGTYGVTVNNTVAWTAPSFTLKQLVAGTDMEYQLCFRCHSSYSSGWPAANTDQSIEFNTLNAGFHWVEGNLGAAKSVGYATASFIAPFTSQSRMYCSDCHRNDTGTVQGPHGSAQAFVLRAPWNRTNTAAGTGQVGTTTHLCFICHAFNSYAAAPNDNNYTNNSPAGSYYSAFRCNGNKNCHIEHTRHQTTNGIFGSVRWRCSVCHSAVPHGYNAHPHMIVLSGDAAGPYKADSLVSAFTHRACCGTDYQKGDCTTTPAGGNCH